MREVEGLYIEESISYPKKLPTPIKNTKETKDLREAVTLVQSGKWIIYNAYFSSDDNKVLFCLAEVG